MKNSDKLSKKELDNPIFDSNKNLIFTYKENKRLLNEIKKIKQDYNLTNQDLLNIIKKHIPVPISIFKHASPLESLVKYLKDNLSLSLHDISSLLNRDQRNIWLTYQNATEKNIILDITSKITIPLELLGWRKLSVLENLVSYLSDKKYSISRISKLVNRGYKTIYTVYSRARRKYGK